MPTLKELKTDEHKAVKDYGTAIEAAKTPVEAGTLHHIQKEEKGHAKELSGLMQGLKSPEKDAKPPVNDMTVHRAQGGYIASHNGEDHVLRSMPDLHEHLDKHLGDDDQNRSHMEIEPDPTAKPRYQLPSENPDKDPLKTT